MILIDVEFLLQALQGVVVAVERVWHTHGVHECTILLTQVDVD